MFIDHFALAILVYVYIDFSSRLQKSCSWIDMSQDTCMSAWCSQKCLPGNVDKSGQVN